MRTVGTALEGAPVRKPNAQDHAIEYFRSDVQNHCEGIKYHGTKIQFPAPQIIDQSSVLQSKSPTDVKKMTVTDETGCPIHIGDVVGEKHHTSPLEHNNYVLRVEDIAISTHQGLRVDEQTDKRTLVRIKIMYQQAEMDSMLEVDAGRLRIIGLSARERLQRLQNSIELT